MKTKLLRITSKRPTATKEFETLLPQLIQIVPWAKTPSEIYHAVLNELTEKPVCPICGLNRTYHKGGHYAHTCGSKSCAAKHKHNTDPTYKEKLSKAIKGRKHTEASIKLMKEKGKVFNSDPAKIEKTRLAVRAKYGVDSVSQLDFVKEKCKQTSLKNYGVEHNLQRPELREINREKMFVRQESNLEKYGVKHNMQIPEFYLKAQKTKLEHKFKTKEYTFPSGRVETIQGYEDIAINELLTMYSENDIVIADNETPTIFYEFKGKQCRYYCDIWIPKANMVIEVKSNYTWEAELDKNKAKEKATIASGFLFKLMMYSKR